MHSKYDEIQEILSNYKKQLPKPDPEWPHEVRRAVGFIHEHLFDQELTVRLLKEKCCCESEYFSTLFKVYTGYGIKKYIIKLRIDSAKKILPDKKLWDLSILEVAIYVGYSGKGAFIHAFKKNEGISPGRWRKK